MTDSILCSGLEKLCLSTNLASSLVKYCMAIEKANELHSFVNASGDTLVIKHILDSLAPISHIDKLMSTYINRTKLPPKLVDLGTGAGLPGIPLAIARPEFQITLVDRMTKRINFLYQMKEELHLDNVTIVEEQAEHLKGSFGVVTFRAFRPFEYKLFKKVFSVKSKDGFIAAYKGRQEKASAELDEIKTLYKKSQIIPIEVPFLDEQRCLVVLE